MTIPAVNFPGTDNEESATQSLRHTLINALALLGSFPRTGLIIKVRETAGKEEIVNWALADQSQIEMIAIGLSVSPPDNQP